MIFLTFKIKFKMFLAILGIVFVVKTIINCVRKRNARKHLYKNVYERMLNVSQRKVGFFKWIQDKLGLNLNGIPTRDSHKYIYKYRLGQDESFKHVILTQSTTKYEHPVYVEMCDGISIPCGGGEKEEDKILFEHTHCDLEDPTLKIGSDIKNIYLPGYEYDKTYKDHHKCVKYMTQKYNLDISKVPVKGSMIQICETKPINCLYIYGSGAFTGEIVSDGVKTLIDHLTDYDWKMYLFLGIVCFICNCIN